MKDAPDSLQQHMDTMEGEIAENPEKDVAVVSGELSNATSHGPQSNAPPTFVPYRPIAADSGAGGLGRFKPPLDED